MNLKYAYFVGIYLMPCVVMGACPSGYVSATRDNTTVIAASCPAGYTKGNKILHDCTATNESCYPEILCTAGSHDLNIGTNTVPLYSVQYTNPSLKVKSGNTICYAPMMAGNISGRLKIKNNNGTIYSHTDLYECKKNIATTDTFTANATTDNTFDWSVKMNDTTITGISFCSNKSAVNFGDTATNITIDSVTISNNIYCWCRAIQPYVSRWAYAEIYSVSGYSGCYNNCNRACVNRFGNTSSFRSGIINSLSK